MNEHLYIVVYDISDPKRWRKIFRLLKGYGEWLQLSVFQCRLADKQFMELKIALHTIIHHGQDHVLLLDIGKADAVRPKVDSLGKKFEPLGRETVIV